MRYETTISGTNIIAEKAMQSFFSNEEKTCAGEYRYAFNGKEIDTIGMGGGGSTYDYGFRIYNAQIAKFLSVDPLTKSYPELTPYQFASNMPIWAIDLDGLEAFVVITGTSSTFDGHAMIVVARFEKVGVFPDGTAKYERMGFTAYSNPKSMLPNSKNAGTGNNQIGYRNHDNYTISDFYGFDAVFNISLNTLSSKKYFREDEIQIELGIVAAVENIASQDLSFGYEKNEYNCTEFVSDLLYSNDVSIKGAKIGQTDVSSITKEKGQTFFNPNQMAQDLLKLGYTADQLKTQNIRVSSFKSKFSKEYKERIEDEE